jgi:hypothetical protein
VSRQELRDAFANGFAIESIEPSQFEVNPRLSGSSFSPGGPKAWFAIIRRKREPKLLNTKQALLNPSDSPQSGE